MQITPVDTIGWLAAALTLLAFSLQSISALRLAALGANVCFIIYGLMGSLYPVLVLHVLLLPCNVLRLWQLSSLSNSDITGVPERRQAFRGPTVCQGPVCTAGRDWLIVTLPCSPQAEEVQRSAA